MQTRRLTIDNYDEMAKLWRKAGLSFKTKGRDSRNAIEAQIKANPDFFLGAFDEGRLVAIVILSFDMRRGWINRLTVDPEYRRRGIAKTLIAESERVLRDHGAHVLCAHIENWNTTSKRLFKGCGYVEHDDVTYFSKRDSDEV